MQDDVFVRTGKQGAEIYRNVPIVEILLLPEQYGTAEERILGHAPGRLDELAHGRYVPAEFIHPGTEHIARHLHPVGEPVQVGTHGHHIAVRKGESGIFIA